ncbi:PREDICTED: interaptin-like [Nanorana parkeri]|uniref:interaptin-like n=1 Tax=Nanorana parkeri TaxID=125878 RepID=UPI000853F4E6|nr:PREDICTED: interaptin-like [Nanorana parkeri]
MLEIVKTDLTTLKDQHQLAVQETLQLQQANHMYEMEMASVRENAHNLQQQAQNYEELVKGLREELNQGQHRQQDEQNQVEEMRRQTVNMETEMERLRSRNKSDAQKIAEQEKRLIKLEDEIRQLQEENRSTQSDFLQAQAQMKILHLNHSIAEKQIKHYTTQAEFDEETIAKLREDLEQSKKRCRKSTKSLESAEQNIYDLNLEMTLLQANHKQTVEQLNEKSKENSAITSEVNSLHQQNKKIRGELSRLKLKLEPANADIKKLQHGNQSTKQEMLPIALPGSYFRTLARITSTYIWQHRTPRISGRVLARTRQNGGLALPDFRLYHAAAQMVRVVDWVYGGLGKSWVPLETAASGAPLSEVIWLPPKWRPLSSTTLPLTASTLRTWDRLHRRYRWPHNSILMPLQGSDYFPPGKEDGSFAQWTDSSTLKLSDVLQGDTLLSLADLGARWGRVPLDSWKHRQLSHFISSVPKPLRRPRDFTYF